MLENSLYVINEVDENGLPKSIFNTELGEITVFLDRNELERNNLLGYADFENKTIAINEKLKYNAITLTYVLNHEYWEHYKKGFSHEEIEYANLCYLRYTNYNAFLYGMALNRLKYNLGKTDEFNDAFWKEIVEETDFLRMMNDYDYEIACKQVEAMFN